MAGSGNEAKFPQPNVKKSTCLYLVHFFFFFFYNLDILSFFINIMVLEIISKSPHYSASLSIINYVALLEDVLEARVPNFV